MELFNNKMNLEHDICVVNTHLKTNVLVRNPPLSGTFSVSIKCEVSSKMCVPACGKPPVGCCAKTTRGFETGAMAVRGLQDTDIHMDYIQ